MFAASPLKGSETVLKPDDNLNIIIVLGLIASESI